MTMRCALYARYSIDLQNPRSIGDQLADARRHAERQGWTVVAEFSDAAISGAAMANRPGVQALLAAAQAGGIDVVLAEDLSRFSRDGGHPWDLYYDLEAAGAQLHTVWRGRVDEMVLGFEGAKNASERKAIGARVRRGQAGLIRDGRQIGPPSLGYRIRREYDAAGEPIRGLREIEPGGAALVRRIFAEFVAGSTPGQIAYRLNGEGVPAITARGFAWVATQVADILKNPIYNGVIVWGAKSAGKDRRTGKVRRRPADPANLIRTPAPELAIVDPATWAAAQARLIETSHKVTRAGTPAAANAPRRLLTGLVRCGCCGSKCHTIGDAHPYRCWRRMQAGPAACDNARGAPAAKLEAHVLDTLKRDLLHPEVIEAAVKEYRAAQAAKGKGATTRRAQAERELAETKRQAEALMNLPPDLIAGPSVAGKLRDLDAKRLTLEQELATERSKAEIVALHPNAAARYVQLVTDLQARLAAHDGPDSAAREAARQALRQIVAAVIIHPLPERGRYRVEIRDHADGLLPMIAEAAAAKRRTGT